MAHDLKRDAIRGAADRFRADESGATAIEYALIGMMIALVIIGSATAIGSRLATLFMDASSAF